MSQEWQSTDISKLSQTASINYFKNSSKLINEAQKGNIHVPILIQSNFCTWSILATDEEISPLLDLRLTIQLNKECLTSSEHQAVHFYMMVSNPQQQSMQQVQQHIITPSDILLLSGIKKSIPKSDHIMCFTIKVNRPYKIHKLTIEQHKKCTFKHKMHILGQYIATILKEVAN